MTETSAEWQQLHLRVHMFAACAVINLQALPDKLNPLVRPLMEAIKREENALIQGYAASFIAKLLQQCAGRSPCPNPKIIKNLCNSACVDSSATPSSACPVPPSQENSKGKFCSDMGINLPVPSMEKVPNTVPVSVSEELCISIYHVFRWFRERWPASHGLQNPWHHHPVPSPKGSICYHQQARSCP